MALILIEKDHKGIKHVNATGPITSKKIAQRIFSMTGFNLPVIQRQLSV